MSQVPLVKLPESQLDADNSFHCDLQDTDFSTSCFPNIISINQVLDRSLVNVQY